MQVSPKSTWQIHGALQCWIFLEILGRKWQKSSPQQRKSSELEILLLFCEPVLATRATKKEYSGELGSQNDSKMESKMEPKRQHPTLTKHTQALSDCISTPLGGLHFRFFFRVRYLGGDFCYLGNDFRFWGVTFAT